MDERIFTTHDISRLLQVDITTVMLWINKGKLPAYRTPGGHRRVFHKDLLAFLKKYKMPIPSRLQKNTIRILLVDEDAEMERTLIRLDKRIDLKIEVKSVSDGFEAGRLVETYQPDLLMMDLTLPRMDGFRACKTLRMDKSKKDVKILALGQHKDEDLKREILKCGADALLAKPISIEALSKTVSGLLGLS